MVLAVLEYNEDSKLCSSQENLIINTCKKNQGLVITVLQDDAAFTATVSPESSCVQRWATRLQLTAPEYLDQLEAALQLSAQHSANSKGKVRQETAAVESGSGGIKKNLGTASHSEGPEHVFEVSSGTLAWKQYFAQKNVHGKRGAIPLEQEPINSAAWSVLREAAHIQRDTLQQLQQLEQRNQILLKEHERAASVAQQGVDLLEQFRQQTYAKFCRLLNSKKQKIRELTQQIKGPNPASVTAPVSEVVAYPSSSTEEPAPKRSNVRVVSGRRKETTTAAAASGAGLNTHDDDGDFDDDTDVDDNLQDEDECNTDEEKELIAQRRVNEPKLKPCAASGGPVNSAPAAASKTKLRAHTSNTKEYYEAGTSSTSKRKEIDNTTSNLSNKKRSNVFDSQDDLFNMSQEEARESLLSNIRPRNDTCEVSRKVTAHCTDTKYSVLARRGAQLSGSCAAGSGALGSGSKGLAYTSNGAAAPGPGRGGKRDEETVCFVASLLRRNVRERQAKGYGMPTRLDDFDLAGRHLDIDFLRKDPLSCESGTHSKNSSSGASIAPSLAASVRQCGPSDDESDQEHHRDFFGEASSEEIPLTPVKTQSPVKCSISNTSENNACSSFLQTNQSRILDSNSNPGVEIVDINATSGVVPDNGQLSSATGLVTSSSSKADKQVTITALSRSSVSHDHTNVQKRVDDSSGTGSQLSDYDKQTEIIDVDNCSLGNNTVRQIQYMKPNKKVLEQEDSKEGKTFTGLSSTNAADLFAIPGDRDALDANAGSEPGNANAPGLNGMGSSDSRYLGEKRPAPKRSANSSSAATSHTNTAETKRIKPGSDDLSFQQFRVGSIIEDVFM